MTTLPLANIFGVEQWMLVIGVIVLLFGGSKIPELMRGVGRGVGELQKGLEDGKRMLHASIEEAKNEPEKTEATPTPVAAAAEGTPEATVPKA